MSENYTPEQQFQPAPPVMEQPAYDFGAGEPVAAPAPAKKKSPLLKIGIIAVAAILVIVLACVLFGGGSEDADYMFDQGLVAVKQNGMWGYVNDDGEMVISPIYSSAAPFAENGLARVSMGFKYGYIDTKGQLALPTIYTSARSFNEHGLAAVKMDESGKVGLYQ